MIVLRKGGLTEFIPSPREKREGLIRDHAFKLLENLHLLLERLERDAALSVEEAEAFAALFKRIKTDQTRNLELHSILITGGIKKSIAHLKKLASTFFNFFVDI